MFIAFSTISGQKYTFINEKTIFFISKMLKKQLKKSINIKTWKKKALIRFLPVHNTGNRA